MKHQVGAFGGCGEDPEGAFFCGDAKKGLQKGSGAP
jgi:hypothetical protein